MIVGLSNRSIPNKLTRPVLWHLKYYLFDGHALDG